MSAQNQHYVPQLILRQFLTDVDKEQVSVFDKHTEKCFITSTKNIMAERRFNDFAFEDWIVSFEPIATGIENIIVPHYQKIIETRRLTGIPEERAALGFLIAFQMVRTKAHREFLNDLETAIKQKVEAMGGSMDQLKGWEPLTEDRLKRDHLVAIRNQVDEFAKILATKDFVLAECGAGRTFYLGDNPVCLHNMRDFGPYGNLGLALPGIEVYLPLASDLMLCAWCPSILKEVREALEKGKRDRAAQGIGKLMRGEITAEHLKRAMDEMKTLEKPTETLISRVAEGTPIPSDHENMDSYNSLQTSFAYRYVICRQSDFDLAKRHNKEFPHLRRGKRPSFA